LTALALLFDMCFHSFFWINTCLIGLSFLHVFPKRIVEFMNIFLGVGVGVMCRQESFSFNTKDRAPYLVTLEVLNLSSTGMYTMSKSLNGGVHDGDRGFGSPTGSGRKFMRMLTPRSLGQSLRGVKAGIDRTLITLTGRMSSESSDTVDSGKCSSSNIYSFVGWGGGCVRLFNSFVGLGRGG